MTDHDVPDGRTLDPGLPLAGIGGLLAAAVGLVWLGGGLGAAAALGLLAIGYAFAPPYGFAAGQFGLAAVVTAGSTPGIAVVGGMQAALFLVLVCDAPRDRRGRRAIVTAAAGALALVALAWWVQTTWEATWVTALVVAGTLGLIGYAIHRYELVATGVVPSDR